MKTIPRMSTKRIHFTYDDATTSTTDVTFLTLTKKKHIETHCWVTLSLKIYPSTSNPMTYIFPQKTIHMLSSNLKEMCTPKKKQTFSSFFFLFLEIYVPSIFFLPNIFLWLGTYKIIGKPTKKHVLKRII